MGHRRQRLSSEEILMIFSLLFSTSVISISFNLKSWSEAAAPVTRISFHAPATSAPARLHRSGLEPVDVSNSAPNPAIESSELGSVRAGSVVTSDYAEGAFSMSSGHSSATDTRFAFAGLSGLRNSISRQGNGEIRVVKPAYADGTHLGNLEVTVSVDGNLSFKSRQLKALLAKPGLEVWSASTQGLDNGLVSFETLREQGILLRYSTKRDAFEISS